MKRILTSLALILGFALQGQSQVLLNQCESATACRARTICGGTIVSNFSYTTSPAFNPVGTCASSTGTFAYASNWVYYRFTCYTTGILNFRLNSNDSTTTASDLDWALWDITATGCNTLTTIVECNAAGNGATGILTGGIPSANFEPNLTITAGNTYIIGISNPGGGNTAGFTLNFTGTTANITDNKKPFMASVAPFDPCSPVSFIKIKLSEPVRCDQIGGLPAPGPADVNISGLATSSFTVTPLNCSGCANAAPNTNPNFFGNATDSIKIDFGGNLAPGTYTITPIANAFFDLCGKSDSLATLTFTVPAPFKDSVRSGFDCIVLKYIDTVYGVNGLSPYQYKAVGGGLPAAAGSFGAPTPSFTVYTVAGGTPVTYTIKDAGGCLQDTTLNRPSVLALGAPNLSASASPPCFNQFSLDSISVISQAGGIGPYSFVCSPTFAGTIFLPTPANPTKWKNLVFPGLGTVFTVTVTDALGCTKTGVKNLVNPTQLVMPTPSVTNPTCFGDSTGKLCFSTATTGTPLYTYSVVPSIPSIIFTTVPTNCFNNLPAGTFTMTVTDANGCTATTTKTLSQPAVITINTSAATILAPTCPNNCNGTYQPIATGGTGGKKFYKFPFVGPGQWDYSDSVVTPITTNKFLNLCAGTYTILAKDALGCTATTTVTLSLPPIPVMNIGTITPVACFGGTGTIPVTITNGTTPYTAASYSYQPGPISGMTVSSGGPGGTIGSYSSVPAGSYNLIIMNANGCSDTVFNVVMTQPAAPVTYSSVVVDSVLCFGTATGTITAQATGGTIGVNSYQYAIKFGAAPFSAFSAATLAPYAFTNLVAGTYTIRVRDHNLCTKDSVVIVRQPTKLNLLLDDIDATCFGTSNGEICVIDTGGTPGYQYKLGIAGAYSAAQPSGTNFCYGGLAAGTYSLFTMDAKGCLDTLTATVASIPLPIVSFTASPNDTVCNGTAITLCGTGADTYNWTGGIFDCTAFTATLGAHQYIVTGTNTTTGCSNKDTVDVLINPIPVLTDPADQVRCNNTATALVNFVSSVAGSTFSWVNSDPSIGLAASGSGNNIPPFLAQNTTNLPVVATITVTATGPAPDFCVSPTQSFTITVNPDAFITLTSAVGTNAQTLCINDVLTDITYAVSGGGTNATVSATLPAGVFGSFSAGVFTISGSPTGPAGVYPYTVTTSGTCLQTTATGTITVSPDATLALSSAAGTNAQTLCINTTLTNINYTVGGTGTFGSVAGLPTGVNGNFAGGVVTISGSPSVSGLFTYTVTATGTCASTTTTGTINVTPLQNPAFSYPSSTYCQTGVNPSPVITGTPGGTFSYTGPGTLQLNATTGVVTLATSNLGTYTIKYLTTGPCPDSSTFLFTITLAPTAGFTYASASYCQNGTDPLPTFAAGASAGVFSSLPNTLTFVSTGTGQIDLSASAAGTYTVTNFIAAAGGCAAASASTVVTIDSTTILTDPSDQVRCNNTATAAVNFVSTVPGSTYSWVNNTPSIGLAASGSGNIAPFLAQNAGTTPVVATITVTPTGPAPDFCTGLPQTFTITVNPDAYIALTSGVGSNTPTLCINDVLTDITYAVTGGGTGATVSALPAGLFGSFSAGVFTISGSPTGPSGVYTYTVTTTGTCAQATSTGTINISPDATLTLTSAAGTNAQTVCINTSITNIKYTVGGTGNFASVAGLPASVNGVFAGGVLTISGSPSVSGLFTYTVTATGTCASTTTTGTINVTPLQDPSFSYALSTYCQTGVDPLAIITGTPGGSFSATPIGLSINATTGLIDLSLSGANTYTVKYLTNGPCPDSSTFTITIIAPPTAGFSYSPASYCQSGVDPLPMMNAGASSGVFSSTAGLSINSATGLIDLSASASGTYIVTNFIAAANGCASVSATTNVTIDSTTILTDPADQVRCNNTATAAVNFVSTVAGSTYSWVNNTPSIGLAANGTGNIAPFLAQNSSNVPVVATITVTPTGPAPNFCDGLPQSFTITVNPDAFISLTSASGTDAQTLCINDVLADITYQVDGGGTGAVVSALPAGLFGTFAGGVFTISGSPTGPSGVYTYTVTTTGTCAQATATGTITISPDATLALGSAAGTDAQTLCINTTLINIKYNVGGTGNFASASGLPSGVTDTYAGGVLTINGTPSVSGLYTYTITASGTCASVTTTGTIDVTPLQDPAFSYALSTYCQTGANPSPTITGTPGGTFSATPAGLSINSATGQIILATSTLGTYAVKYVTNGPCPDSSTFNVTITTAPTTGFSYASASYCQNGIDPSPVFAAGASAGVFSAVPATLAFLSTSTGQIDLSASAAGTYTVTNFIAAAGGCAPSTSTTIVTIDSTTILTDPADQVRCNNVATAAVNFVSTVVPTTYTWTHNATAAIGIATSGSGNIPSFIPVNTGTTPILVTFTVNPTGPAPNFCTGVAQQFTLTINPDAKLNLTSAAGTNAQTVCINTPITNIVYAVGGTGNNASAAGLPAGVTGVYNAGVFTISGSPSVSGAFTYTVTATGTCASTTSTGTITVNPNATLTLTSAAATTNQSVCRNSPITNITYTVGATGNNSSVAGLPPGVNTSGTTSVTISGTPTVAGSYTYTVTATGTCGPATSTGTILVNPLQDPTFTYPNPTNCQFGTTSPNVLVTPGGTFSYTGAGTLSINTSTGVINLATSTVGGYTIKYVTPGPCKDSTTISITITNAPSAQFTYASANYCQSAANPSPIYNGPPTPSSGGVYTASGAGLVFAVLPAPIGTINLLASTPGTYSVYNTIAASGACPSVADTFVVTITSKPTLSFVSSTQAGCNPNCNGTVTTSVAGGNGVYSYGIAPGGVVNGLGVASSLCAGTVYTITVTDGIGCTGTLTASVTTAPSPTIATTTITGTVVGACDGKIIALGAGGTPGYIYSILPITAQAPIGTFNNICDTVGGANPCYTVTVTDTKGCTSNSIVCLNAPGALACAITSQVNVSCFGGSNGSFDANASGGTPPLVYTISGGATINSSTGVAANLPAGSYIVTVTDSNNLALNTPVNITQPAALTFTVPVISTPSCSPGCDGTMTITATGGTGTKVYAITSPVGMPCNAAPGATAGSFSGLGVGTYTILVTDANNCTKTTTVQINASPNPTLNLNHVNPACNNNCNGIINATGGAGTPAFTYQIISPSGTVCVPTQSAPTSGAFSTLGGGVYTVQVSDSKGCTATGTQTLVNPALLILNPPVTTSPLCNGSCDGTVTLTSTGGNGGNTFSLSLPLTTNATGIFNLLCAGTYTVSVKDIKNCSSTGTVQINNPASVTWTSTNFTNITCFGSANGTISVAATGGTGTIEYSRNGGATYFPSGNFTALSAGTYTIIAKDANNCSITTSFTIIEPPVLTLGAPNVTNVTCNGANDGIISILAGGGTPGYTYLLTPTSATNSTGNFTSLAPGTYTVKVTDAAGCTTNVTGIVVTQPAPLVFTLVNHQDVACFGDATGTITVNSQGGTPTITYSLAPNIGVQGPTGFFSGLTAGTYTVNATDVNNCATSTVVTVTQGPQILFLNATMTEPICHGDANGSISFTVIGGTGQLKYKINGGTLQTDTVFNNLLAGNYLLTVVDALACSKDTLIVVTEPDAVGAIINLQDANCKDSEDGKAIIIGTGGRGGYKYYLTPGLHINKSGIFVGLEPGSYLLRVVDTSGCEYRTNITINPPANPLANTVTKQDLACNGVGNEGTATANVAGGTPPYTYLWSTEPPQTTSKASTLYFGYYDVTVTDANGCVVKDTVYIEEGPCCDVAFIPNAFSPNGDQVNDEFRVLTTAGVELIQLEIYNRWGKRVWSTIDYRRGWDGLIDGKDAAIDTYYYIFRYKCTRDNGTYTKKGDLILIR